MLSSIFCAKFDSDTIVQWLYLIRDNLDVKLVSHFGIKLVLTGEFQCHLQYKTIKNCTFVYKTLWQWNIGQKSYTDYGVFNHN